MSGARFEGLEGIVPRQEERYEPGRGPSECHLKTFEELVNAQLTYEKEADGWTRHSVEASFRSHDENLERFACILGEAALSGPFNAQGFLDDLVWLSADSRMDLRISFIDDAIQALYRTGHNNLVLDLALFGEDSAAVSLKGTPENPLCITVVGYRPGARVGHLSEHVKMTVKGDVEQTGYFARCSEFHIDGTLQEVSGGNKCDYYLHALSAMKKVVWPRDCRYFLKEEPGTERMPEHWERLFEKGSGNEVYVADSSGGWMRYVLKGGAIMPEQRPWWRFWERRGGPL